MRMLKSCDKVVEYIANQANSIVCDFSPLFFLYFLSIKIFGK